MTSEMLRVQHFVVNDGAKMSKTWGLLVTELATGFGKKPPAMTWKASRQTGVEKANRAAPVETVPFLCEKTCVLLRSLITTYLILSPHHFIAPYQSTSKYNVLNCHVFCAVSCR